jgi:hypothetical protein
MLLYMGVASFTILASFFSFPILREYKGLPSKKLLCCYINCTALMSILLRYLMWDWEEDGKDTLHV